LTFEEVSQISWRRLKWFQYYIALLAIGLEVFLSYRKFLSPV
jgi:hypothetical protein